MSEQTEPRADEKVRNVILCFDGTGDWVLDDETNVAKIYRALDKKTQLTYYDGGVGTLNDSRALTSPQRTALRLIDLGTATSLRDKVLQAYVFLVRKHQSKDRIYLFGFSRGAYTARVLAAMIHNFGLLRPESEHLAPYLWQTMAGPIFSIGRFDRSAALMKRNFGRDEAIGIHFMGLFDTVSSVGVVGRFATYPNTDMNPAVLRTCHAVSIDEQRNVFPETLMSPKQKGLTEVWFPGVHRDSGGGLLPEKSRIADESLRWIATEATRSDLKLDTEFASDATCPPQPNYPLYDPYVFLGLYPMRMFSKRVLGYRLYWPNYRHIRTVPECASVHAIAFAMKEAEGSTYAPLNWPTEPVRFQTGDPPPPPAPFRVKRLPFSPSDAVGIPIGVALMLMVWNLLVGSPWGASWPYRWVGGWLLLFPFFIFLLCQFVGQRLTERLPVRYRPRPEGFLPLFGGILILACAACLFVPELSWPLLLWGLGAGVVTVAIGQLSPKLPTKLPVMQYDRVLAFVLQAALASVALLWGLNLVSAFSGWIVHGLFGRSLPDLRGVSPEAPSHKAPLATAVLVLLVLDAFRRIVQDRQQMIASETQEV